MRSICSFLFLLLFTLSCKESSNEKGDNHKSGVVSKDSVASMAEKTDSVNFESFSVLFPVLDDSLILIDAIDFSESDYSLLDSALLRKMNLTTSEYCFTYYATGRIRFTDKLEGYIIHTQGYEGQNAHLSIFNSLNDSLISSCLYIASSLGDAGEVMRTTSWLVDIDHDGLYELLQRSGTTFLEIDADESERETIISDVEVFKFDTISGKFKKLNEVEGLDTLNHLFKVDLFNNL